MTATAPPTTDSGAITTVQNLTVRYGSMLALDQVNFELPAGSVTGLLGPNGAGKSTLLKALLGFLNPTSGAIQVLGLSPWHSPLAFRQKLGFMPEHETWFPNTSGLQAVVLAGRLAGMPKEAAFSRAYEVLDYLGMDEVRLRPVEGYSIGLKQKIKLAQALVHGPSLLLLDEPMSGLDPNSRDEMMRLLAGICRTGVSMVLSSHVLHDVERLCDRILALAGGKVLYNGSLDALRKRNETTFHVRFRGDADTFQAALARLGAQGKLTHQRLEVLLPSTSTKPIFLAAKEAGIELREVLPGNATLEEAFLSLVGGA